MFVLQAIDCVLATHPRTGGMGLGVRRWVLLTSVGGANIGDV
ncbi:hypothetical protein KS4_05990 [Poriferisphaera corsica]|uniref:Uncharacterized protein n=1 Tax=Poriferisphaera corsica TaxID=2528020 RepID=A0A517YQR0_9BACT|nr:hypothetical protein KS4_05990 [Poriferisphaera corsica]